MRRKILMGVFALALPLGTLAAFSSAASAKKPPPNPITCTHFGSTITFGTPLSTPGVATSSKLANATTVAGGSFDCGGGISNASFGNLTIPGGKNPKLSKSDPRYNKATGVKYVAGTKASFVSGGAKSLKKSLKIINFTVNGHATQFKTKGNPAEVIGGACPAEVGFRITGQVKTGFYDTKSAVLLVCIGGDTGPGTTGSFGVDILTNSQTQQIVTASIDPAEGTATL